MLTLSHRPFSLNDMVGQKTIIKEMKNKTKKMNFPEIMIFEGASGTGKTTMAYILSALLNDPDPIVYEDGSKDPNPESFASKSVISGKFNRDISFYDASSMSKEDVLALSRVVDTAPFFDENKILIIDEAQELSKAGKGATLSLLEKKKPNVYIILCTMDISKFDKAVRTRGQSYKFKPVSHEVIYNHLLELVDKIADDYEEEPSVDFLSEGLDLIAEASEGSVRKAVADLERCMSGQLFDIEELRKELEILSVDELSEIIGELTQRNVSVVGRIVDFGVKEFFYKSFKTLTTAYIYNMSGYIDQDWKEKFARKLSQYDLKPILDIYVEIDQYPYFKPDLFLYKIVGLFEQKDESVPERKPKKKGRVPAE